MNSLNQILIPIQTVSSGISNEKALYILIILSCVWIATWVITGIVTLSRCYMKKYKYGYKFIRYGVFQLFDVVMVIFWITALIIWLSSL